jgi:integrase/recombinase XerD
MNQSQWMKIGEAAALANVSNVQYLHKLRNKGHLPAYYEQKGQLKYWYVDINSERFQKLLHRNDKPDAPAPLKTNKPFDWIEWEAMLRRGEEIVKKACSETTIKNYRYYIQKFFQTYPCLNRDTLREALKVYEDKEDRDRDYYSSKEHLFLALVSVAKYFAHKGYESPELVKSLEYLRPVRKVKKRNVRWYDAQVIQKTAEKVQIAKTKKNAPAYSEYNAVLNSALVYFALYTAARASEIADVRLRDINWKEDSLELDGKGGKWRPVGMSQVLKKALRAYLVKRPKYATTDHLFVDDRTGNPLRPGYIRNRMKRAGKWMNINLAPHDVRRSALTWFLTEKKLDLATVRDIAGHSDFTITNRYAKPPAKRVIDAMKAL